MAAKLLHSLTDDNPDLQKQIGCMTGIFQLFDRQHLVTPRRITGHSPKRLPPGSSNLTSETFERESNHQHQRSMAMENHANKNALERQRASTESSRASFSSSRSSSFSSLDGNRTAKPEHSSFDRIIFPETPPRDAAMNQSNSPPQFVRRSHDLRDVVRHSMNREAQAASVRTPVREEKSDPVRRPGDYSRPLQPPRNVDDSYGLGLGGKQNLPVDIKESFRVFAKFQEVPWYMNEPRELSRSSSYHSKEVSSFSIPKDAPRFSYDGRELLHSSSESRDTSKSALKFRETPRRSVENREGHIQGFKSDLKSNFSSKASQKDNGETCVKVSSPQQTPGTQTRPPSVVAKLMGLEALPDSSSATESTMDLSRTSAMDDHIPLPRRSIDVIDPFRPVQVSNSSKNLWKEPNSPRWRSPDSAMKPISRFPIEPAPWKQLDKTRVSQKQVPHKMPPQSSNPFPSVYSEIEKRLKEIEFAQSGRDLRALKQILEAMQAKGLLETEKDSQSMNFTTQGNREQFYSGQVQKARLVSQLKSQNNQFDTSTKRSVNSLGNFESPIVIMKPAKLVERSRIPAISLDSSSSLPRLHSAESVDSRKLTDRSITSRDQTPKSSRAGYAVNSYDKRTDARTLKPAQSPTRSQQLPKENTTGITKSSGSISPRMQKKLEMEKRSRPPTPPSDSNRSRRQSSKQAPESSSPGGRRRPKHSNFQQSDEQLSEISGESRTLCFNESEASVQSEGSVLLDSNIDTEVSSFPLSVDMSRSPSPSIKAGDDLVSSLMEKKSTFLQSEDELLAEPAGDAPEYPSPVSVLDSIMHLDDSPSPSKHILKTLRDVGSHDRDASNIGYYQSPDNLMSYGVGYGLTSEINREKLQNIENLVQKLRRLNSNHDEARTDYIASLCENANPEHRYTSEILLASGLLLSDLGSSLNAFQFHSSGNPINPELFLVLEQTKTSTSVKEECRTEKLVRFEKCQRKLIFDVVNEILAVKLASVVPMEPRLRPQKLARNAVNGQKLLRELCFEIEQLQGRNPGCCLDEDDDGFKSILFEDVLHRSEGWTDYNGEVSAIVLDVERLIFKDLVKEVVVAEEAAGTRKKQVRRRQLFGN